MLLAAPGSSMGAHGSSWRFWQPMAAAAYSRGILAASGNSRRLLATLGSSWRFLGPLVPPGAAPRNSWRERVAVRPRCFSLTSLSLALSLSLYIFFPFVRFVSFFHSLAFSFFLSLSLSLSLSHTKYICSIISHIIYAERGKKERGTNNLEQGCHP